MENWTNKNTYLVSGGTVCKHSPDVSVCNIEMLGMGRLGTRLVCMCTSLIHATKSVHKPMRGTLGARYSFKKNFLASSTNLALNFFVSSLHFQALPFCIRQASKQPALFYGINCTPLLTF